MKSENATVASPAETPPVRPMEFNNGQPSSSSSRPSQAGKSTRRRKLVVGASSLVLLCALIGGVLYLVHGKLGTARTDLVLHKVKYGRLELTVVERGSLESTRNSEVFCRVKTATAKPPNIKTLIDDGAEVMANRPFEQTLLIYYWDEAALAYKSREGPDPEGSIVVEVPDQKTGQKHLADLLLDLEDSALQDQLKTQKTALDTAELNKSNADETLKDQLKQNPKDDEARYGLGTIQFVRSFENLSQATFRLHPRGLAEQLPILRVGGEKNDLPETVTYAKARALFENFASDLARAEATLAEIRDEKVKLPIHLGRIRLDLNGDGHATDEELLWKLYERVNFSARNIPEKDREELVVAFDRGDVAWFRGYCHLLMSFCDIVLAYDESELFKRVGHALFEKTDTPYTFLTEHKHHEGGGFIFWDFEEIADIIASIHLINFPLHNRDHLKSAHGHLKQVVALSRETWKYIEAETDDDHEWIPNPNQHSAIAGLRVTKEMIAGWKEFLDEADDLLDGRKLLIFWRGTTARGVNLKKVFLEPRDFDLVLWIQGTQAAPYLEAGQLTRPETWQRFDRIFRGEFIGFAMWFN